MVFVQAMCCYHRPLPVCRQAGVTHFNNLYAAQQVCRLHSCRWCNMSKCAARWHTAGTKKSAEKLSPPDIA